MLELVGAARTYNGGIPVHALSVTDLVIEEGEYLSITGSSGSGKSTLLNLLGLLDSPTDGDYLVRGQSTRNLDVVSRGAIRGQLFGFVFQAFHLLPRRSAVENVELGMLYGPFTARERRRRAVATLDRIGLSHRAHADPRQLSGGEQQRVAIARAVASGPRALFCDEPTGNLDSENSQNVLDLLEDLHADGLTLVIVTHDAQIAQHALRRLRLTDGTAHEQ